MPAARVTAGCSRSGVRRGLVALESITFRARHLRAHRRAGSAPLVSLKIHNLCDRVCGHDGGRPLGVLKTLVAADTAECYLSLRDSAPVLVLVDVQNVGKSRWASNAGRRSADAQRDGPGTRGPVAGPPVRHPRLQPHLPAAACVL